VPDFLVKTGKEAGKKLPSEGRRPTIVDVARLAGVSAGTVSKVLNERGSLRESTRRRVLETAETLGFRPNSLARGLLSGRSYTVGLLTTDHVGRFSLPVLLGAEDTLGVGEISVFLCDSRGDAIRERQHLRTLLARRIDGLIVTGRRTDPRPPLPVDVPVPVVYAMAPSTNPADMSVLPDEAGGAELAVRHLLATGRTRIAHVTGPQRHNSARVRAERAEAVLAEAGRPMAAGGPRFGEWSERWGRQAAQAVLREQPDCDAIFCGSDQIARGVVEILRELGRVVPTDVAVVGFDNWEVMATAARPPLTTVDMELAALGQAAAERLRAAIDGSPMPGAQQLPCTLVLRDSTDPTLAPVRAPRPPKPPAKAGRRR
jgi:LacI family transcriptional regulator